MFFIVQKMACVRNTFRGIPFLLRDFIYPEAWRCAILFTQTGLEMRIYYEIYL